ncbi:hypothetical protein QYF36_021682 [Acer negundo]|nr:hypothetical protein QYF36_021682 [Acer negundo]
MPNFEFRWCIKLMNIKSSVLDFQAHHNQSNEDLIRISSVIQEILHLTKCCHNDGLRIQLSMEVDHATYRCFQLWLADLRIMKNLQGPSSYSDKFLKRGIVLSTDIVA